MTMYDSRTRLRSKSLSEVRDFFGEKVLDTLIPRTVRLSEAPSFGKPVLLRSVGQRRRRYASLAKEVVDRV